MASLKSRFVVPALLAGAAVLTGCDSKNPHEDLAGMKDSIAAACPTENKDTDTRAQCATVGQAHAQKLFAYSGIGDQFQKSCTFNALPAGVPSFAAPLIVGAQAGKCLKAVESNAADDVVKQTAREVRKTMALGLAQ